MRGKFSSSSSLYSFKSWAWLTSAASVGSPTASCMPRERFASEQQAMALASSTGSSVKVSTTVMRFCVKVPVLSEQMICVQPKVSTAVSLRMSACRLDMAVTPMDRMMVTTAGRPSGMAATASAMAAMKVFRPALPSSDQEKGSSERTTASIRPTANTTTQIPSTSLVRNRDSSAIFFCSGVCSFSASVSASAILPISVSMPVAVTTAVPRP